MRRGRKISPGALVVPGILLALVVGLVVFLAVRPKPRQVQPAYAGVTILLPNDELSAVALYDGLVWCGGREGLYRMDPKTLEPQAVNLPEGLPRFRYVRGILPLGNALWVAYDGGVARYEEGGWQVASEGFPDLRMTCLCPAPDGSGMWAGSYNGAVLLSNDMRVQRTLLAEDGLLSSMVNVVAADPFGQLWFGSYLERPGTGGISILRGDGSFQYITMQDGLPHQDITDLLYTERGMLVATGMLGRGGAALLAPNEAGVYSLRQAWYRQDGLAGDKVRSLFEYEGQLWFCSEVDGIAVWQNGVFIATLTKAQGLSDNEIKDMALGADGTLYFASRYGLTCVEPQAVGALLARGAPAAQKEDSDADG